MRAKEEAFRLLETALSIASTGVEEAEVSLGGGVLGLTPFAENQLGVPVESAHELISVRVRNRKRVSRVTTSDLSASGIKEAAHQARLRVEHLPAGVESPSFPDPQVYEQVDAEDAETETLRGLDRTALASRAILAGLKAGLSARGCVAVRRGAIDLDGVPGTYAVANTRGLLAYHAETRLTYSVTMTRADGASGWAGEESYSAAGVDVDELVRAAIERASLRGPPLRLASGSYPAVLEPAAVAALLAPLGGVVGAALAAEGGSFLSAAEGTKITGAQITLADDHAHPAHRGTPFDLEGVARRRVLLVENGQVGAPVCGWATAARLRRDPTGHRAFDPRLGEVEVASHLVMEGGNATRADLVGGLKRGVLIPRLTAVELLDPRTMELTGMTEGLAIVEGGAPVAVAQPMRFSVKLFELLERVESLAQPVLAGGVVAPALAVSFPLSSGGPS